MDQGTNKKKVIHVSGERDMNCGSHPNVHGGFAPRHIAPLKGINPTITAPSHCAGAVRETVTVHSLESMCPRYFVLE